jgi:hypothetical protein
MAAQARPACNNNAKAFSTVRKRGAEAARAGRPITSCPYKATPGGGANFSNKWRVEWLKGFNSVKHPPTDTSEVLPP